MVTFRLVGSHGSGTLEITGATSNHLLPIADLVSHQKNSKSVFLPVYLSKQRKGIVKKDSGPKDM